MRLKPANLFKPWTLEELSTLERLIEEDASTRVIARKLSRTLDALEYMMEVENLSLKGQLGP